MLLALSPLLSCLSSPALTPRSFSIRLNLQLLVRRLRPQLQRMNPSAPIHLLLEQRVHHAMPSGLWLGCECGGDDC